MHFNAIEIKLSGLQLHFLFFKWRCSFCSTTVYISMHLYFCATIFASEFSLAVQFTGRIKCNWFVLINWNESEWYHNRLNKIMQTIVWQLIEWDQRMNNANKHAINLSKVIKLNAMFFRELFYSFFLWHKVCLNQCHKWVFILFWDELANVSIWKWDFACIDCVSAARYHGPCFWHNPKCNDL